MNSILLVFFFICCALSAVVAFSPFNAEGKLNRNSFALFSRHGRKKWIELGVVPISSEEDKKRWEASQKKWEESGKKGLFLKFIISCYFC